MCVWLCAVQHERMKFLCIGTRMGVEVYAWAQKPYSKFMAFKVSVLGVGEGRRVFEVQFAVCSRFLTCVLSQC